MGKDSGLEKGMKNARTLLETAEQILYSDPKGANKLIDVAKTNLEWCSIKLHKIQGDKMKD
jgi:hypothetical protein